MDTYRVVSAHSLGFTARGDDDRNTTLFTLFLGVFPKRRNNLCPTPNINKLDDDNVQYKQTAGY